MDPLSALSIAATVVQFVDFASKIFIRSYEVYRSEQGASQDDINVLELNEELQVLCIELQSNAAPSIAGRRDEDALRNLSGKCLAAAKKLSTVLEQVRTGSSKGIIRGWNAFHGTLKRLVKEKTIKKLQDEVDSIRQQMDTLMLAMLRSEQSKTRRTIQNLLDSSTTMRIEFKTQLESMRHELIAKLTVQQQQLASRDIAQQGQALADREDRHLILPKDGSVDLVKDQNQIERLKSDYTALLSKYKESLLDVTASLDHLREEARRIKITQSILASLEFVEMPWRHKSIVDAHEQTFSWIFDHDKTGFPEWLSTGNGIYWISGKAGSGKSTLMKFLEGHSNTTELLSNWAGETQLLMVKYFFWNSGTPMQKSQQGLLQSLLLQILRKCPQLVPDCFPTRWDAATELYRSPEPWSRVELLQGLNYVLSLDSLPVKLCLFVDGLDEFEDSLQEGGHYELIKTLGTLVHRDMVKLCVSSRPWTEMRDAYKDDPNLTLQDWTRPDVELFARVRLGRDERYLALAKKDANAETFLQQIIDKAQGVFLWVHLVTNQLLRDMSRHHDIAALQRRLDSLPSDLKTFFERMLNNIEVVYRSHAGCFFQMAVLASPVPLVAFLYIPEELDSPDFIYRMAIKAFTRDDLKRIGPVIDDCINNWCRDMIESYCDPTEPAEEFDSWRLDFAHRTVRDFLLENDIAVMVQEMVGQDHDPWRMLLQAHLARIKCLPAGGHKMKPFMHAAYRFMALAKQYELNRGRSPSDLLQELDRVGNHHQQDWLRKLDEHCDFPAYAISFGLNLYIKDNLVQASAQHLDFSLRSEIFNRIEKGYPDVAMVKLLLDKGANMNESLGPGKNRTPWHRYLLRCQRFPKPKFFEAAKLMLERGAALVDDVVIGERQESRISIPLTRKNGQHIYNRETTRSRTTYANVFECLSPCCTSKESAAELNRLLEERAKSSWSLTSLASSFTKLLY